MESEINDATVGDIYVEQALAEMEVAYALASSYMKDSMYVEYLAEMYGEDSEVFQESIAESVREKLKSKEHKEAEKNMGSAPPEIKDMMWRDMKAAKRGDRFDSFKDRVKALPGNIYEFLKTVANAIITAATNLWHFITEKSLKTCIKKLKELPGDKVHNISPYLKEAHKRILMETKGFTQILEEIASGREIGDVKLKEFKDPTNYIYKHTKENSSTDSETVTTAELITIFEKLVSDDSKNEIKNAIKKVKEIQKVCDKQAKKYASNMSDKEARKEYKNDATKYNANTMKAIKESAKTLVSAYSNVIREYRSLANKVLKIDKAAYKADAKFAKKTGIAFGADE